MASHGEKDKSKNTMCFLFSLYTKEQKGADLSYLSVCLSVCQIMALYVFAVNLFLKIRSIKRHFLSNFFQLCNFIINTPVCAIPFRHYFDPLGIFSLLRCKVFPFPSHSYARTPDQILNSFISCSLNSLSFAARL